MFIWFLISSSIVSYIIFPYLVSFLSQTGCTRENFRGKLIPVGSGILLIVTPIAVLGLTSLVFKSELATLTLALTTLILGVGFFGILDDLLGDRSVRGFRGHFQQLQKGYLTTGVLKALGSGALSLFVAGAFSDHWLWLILNGLIIALSVNAFNLLDLRPGRALKVFAVTSLIILIYARQSYFWPLLGLFIGPALLLLQADLDEVAMLGDTGSNILGAIIGFSFIVTLDKLPKLIILGVLILIHFFAERYSLSEFITQQPALRKFDEWGRKG